MGVFFFVGAVQDSEAQPGNTRESYINKGSLDSTETDSDYTQSDDGGTVKKTENSSNNSN